MANITYYVALPFLRTREGRLVAGEVHNLQSSTAAISAAASLARRAPGAVAFSRTGDPSVDDFGEAVILRQFGEVPNLAEVLGGT